MLETWNSVAPIAPVNHTNEAIQNQLSLSTPTSYLQPCEWTQGTAQMSIAHIDKQQYQELINDYFLKSLHLEAVYYEADIVLMGIRPKMLWSKDSDIQEFK